jgi:hypothetical protein
MFNLKFNKMRTIYGLLVFVLLAGFTIACDKDDDKIDESSAKTAKLPHMGFDFSEGKAGGDVDGEVVGWYPASTNGLNLSGLYWRNNMYGLHNEQKHYGQKDLGDIKDVPTTWDNDTLIYPLMVGHVYAVKCRDGVALFKITSLGTTVMEADAEYVFTSGSSF